MNLLLDTHTFIWWDNEPTKLPPPIIALCSDPANTLWLSVASLWEVQIKLQLGKLKLALPLEQVVKNQRQTNALQILPIALEHVLALDQLPPHHKDPFDRLIVAQARVEAMTLITHAPLLSNYPVKVIW